MKLSVPPRRYSYSTEAGTLAPLVDAAAQRLRAKIVYCPSKALFCTLAMPLTPWPPVSSVPP